MQLIAVSDLHIDINEKRYNQNFSNKFTKYIDELGGDILLVTGDIAGNLEYLTKFFALTKDLAIENKIFVPGNHDIWVNQYGSNGSWLKYDKILPEICKLTGWHYLPNNPIIIQNIAFAGTIGWYDYSTRNKIWYGIVGLEIYANKVNPRTNSVWMDREFAKFGDLKDMEIADIFSQRLENDLENLNVYSNGTNNYEINEKIEKVVIGTHIVPFLKFIRYKGKLEWDFFSAFIGNTKLGDLIKRIDPRLAVLSIFGHTHFPNIAKVTDNITGYCVPIGYPHEFGSENSIENVFDERIVTIGI